MKYYGSLLIAFFILLGACEIKKPTLPDWDVNLALPLINQRFYASELVDSTNIVIDSTNVLTLQHIGENTTPQINNVPFSPGADIDSVPVPGTGFTGFMPFIDSNNQVEVAYAQFASGILKHRFLNVNSNVQELHLVLHNFYNASGDELTLTYNGETGWVNTSLAGCHMGTLNSQQIITEIPFSLEVVPVLPATTIAATFSFQANTLLEFSYFQGLLDNYSLSLNESNSTVEIDYPFGINEAVTLQQATLTLEIENRIGFSAEFSGKFRATNDQGETRTIDIVDENGDNYHTVPALSTSSPGISYLQFTTNISQLLQIMPTNIEIIDGMFTISTGQTIGSAQSTDIIKVNYRVSAPFNFILHAHEIVVKEESVINVSEDNQARIRNNALSAELELKIQNTLPIGAHATLYLSSSPNIDITNPATYDFIEHAAIYSSITNPGWQTLDFSLPKAEMDVFAHPEVYLRFSFSFEESGEPIVIHATTSDFIHIRGMMNASIRIEGAK
ncbi:MAG: hypothetical protein RBS43_01030 [Candidatus Cloacimonas sp.]|jgi:hypothetical protein|nr:hypothetical protein [Candidatus Cloacimonas sp.]